MGGNFDTARWGSHFVPPTIGQQLSEVLRLAASLQHGTVTASLILRKLGSYPRQNSLALALREIGRIERTLFMLAWLEDLRHCGGVSPPV
jgi:TnpA family transposase